MQHLQCPELAARAAPEGFVLLDVREPWEVQTAPVACICHHGARSAQVVAFLMHQGYADVYNLAGGIDAWSALVDPQVPRY